MKVHIRLSEPIYIRLTNHRAEAILSYELFSLALPRFKRSLDGCLERIFEQHFENPIVGILTAVVNGLMIDRASTHERMEL